MNLQDFFPALSRCCPWYDASMQEMTRALEALNTYFGYDSFRPGQEQAVNTILAGQDLLAVMPTGAGKSVCFQVPALTMPGITLVISPLISLMQDQVRELLAAGIPAAYFNRSLSAGQYRTALARMRQGQYRIVYAAPERLTAPAFLDICRELEISLIAVDEAHCVSQWGQDFRPSYLKIREFIDSLPKRPPVAAFTATATTPVRKQIISLLGLQNPAQVVTGFDRPNLTWQVRRESDRKSALAHIIRQRQDQSGIVYCATRKTVEEVAEHLQKLGLSARPYHAGMSEEKRRQTQDDFIYDRIPVIVATNAFGMGINKPDVRYVVHYQMPGSMEAYYQEAGRAGRDGDPAQCILLYSPQDLRLQTFMIENGEPNPELSAEEAALVQKRDMDRLFQMRAYAQSTSCLRSQILRYFGEDPKEDCGKCSNCLADYEDRDVTAVAMALFAGIIRTGSRFGQKRVIEVLRGADTEFIRSRNLKDNPAYGKLREHTAKSLEELTGQLCENGYLQITGDYPVLSLTKKAVRTISSHSPVVVKTATSTQRYTVLAESDDLFEALRQTRRELASRHRIPAYAVFNDATLHAMAAKKPCTKSDMLRVQGVGDVKFRKYGNAFLRTIQKWNRENGQEEEAED